MNKEFNLSRHISYKNIHVKWVEEFIRLLKCEIIKGISNEEKFRIINKLSGKKLTGAKQDEK